MSRRDRLSPAEEWELPLSRCERRFIQAVGLFCVLVMGCAIAGAYAIGAWIAGKEFGL